MSNEKHFRAFVKVFIQNEYRKLWLSLWTAYGGLFGFRKYGSSNPVLVMDHGLLWRVLRDVVVVITTLIRAAFGAVVIITIFLAVPALAVLRFVVIPISGVIRGLVFKGRVEGAKRAFTKAGS